MYLKNYRFGNIKQKTENVSCGGNICFKVIDGRPKVSY